MKYCEKCGNKMEDNEVFCGNCGAKAEKAQDATNEVEKNHIGVEEIKRKIKNVNKKTCRIIVGVAILVVVGLLVFLANRNKINVYDYVTVQFKGYNTVGTASINVDYEKLVMDILRKKGIDVSDIDDLKGTKLSKAKKILGKVQDDDFFEYQLDSYDNLTNGDKIKASFVINKSVEKDLGIKFVAKDKTYVVENLKEIQKINPFDYVNVEFSGISPNVYASIKMNSDANSFVKGLHFNIDKKKIALGDKITVTIDVDINQAAKEGYDITQTSKEYTCENADSYVADISKIPSEEMKKLQKNATDKIESYIASFSSSNNVRCKDLNYEGTYVLLSKSNNSNVVYLVYSGTVSAEPKYGKVVEPTKVYFPVYISDVVLKANNKIETGTYYNIKGYTSLGSIYINGYVDAEEMYKEVVTASKNNYTIQVSGNITAFGK